MLSSETPVSPETVTISPPDHFVRPPEPLQGVQSSGAAADLKTTKAPPRFLSFAGALCVQSVGPGGEGSSWIPVGENDISHQVVNGIRSLSLSDEFRNKLCRLWTKTVVVRLLGKYISYPFLCNRLRAIWKLVGHMHVVDLDRSCFMVKFANEQDYFKALTEGPWVPIQFYHPQILTSLGNLIGRTVKIDANTQRADRGKFARLAVEIDLKAPLIPVVNLDGALQPVEYENIPTLCFSCGKVGHEASLCPLSIQGNTEKESRSSSAGIEGLVGTAEALTPVNEGFGPWMIVTRQPGRSRKVSVPEKEGVKISDPSLPLRKDTAAANKGKESAENQQVILKNRELIGADESSKEADMEGSGKGVTRRRKRESKTSPLPIGSSDAPSGAANEAGSSRAESGDGPGKPKSPPVKPVATTDSSPKPDLPKPTSAQNGNPSSDQAQVVGIQAGAKPTESPVWNGPPLPFDGLSFSPSADSVGADPILSSVGRFRSKATIRKRGKVSKLKSNEVISRNSSSGLLKDPVKKLVVAATMKSRVAASSSNSPNIIQETLRDETGDVEMNDQVGD
ncbi:hypothetical protein LINPERHAP2_LOCUS26434 [Linum perenne]